MSSLQALLSKFVGKVYVDFLQVSILHSQMSLLVTTGELWWMNQERLRITEMQSISEVVAVLGTPCAIPTLKLTVVLLVTLVMCFPVVA
jgi:hypothetical protein